MRLHRHAQDHGHDRRLVFVPNPVCWTEVPDRLRDLGNQRSRWERGLIDTLWRHRRMIGNLRYGVVGMLSLPFYVAFEFLGAFIETIGYVVFALSWILGAISVQFALAFIAIALISGVLLSLAAVLLEDVAFRRHGRPTDLLRLLAYAVLENFGYRQILTLYRVRGFFAYLRRDNSWGEMQRRGFAGTGAPEDSPASLE